MKGYSLKGHQYRVQTLSLSPLCIRVGVFSMSDSLEPEQGQTAD